jgi:hypothetical protein
MAHGINRLGLLELLSDKPAHGVVIDSRRHGSLGYREPHPVFSAECPAWTPSTARKRGSFLQHFAFDRNGQLPSYRAAGLSADPLMHGERPDLTNRDV